MTQTFLGLFFLLGIGAAYRWLPGAPNAGILRQGIGSIVLHMLLPALTFRVLATAPLGSDVWTVPLTSIATVAASYGVAWLWIVRGLGRRIAPPTAGALMLAAVWCNCTYLGLPIVTGLLGDHVQRVPLLFDLLGMSPMLFTLGVVTCQRFGTTASATSLRHGLRTVLTLPPFIAAVAGLGVNLSGITIPAVILDMLGRAGSIVAPLMMLSIGLGLQRPSLAAMPLLTPVIAIKLVLAPAVAMGIALPLITSPDIYTATILEAGMPTMMLTMVFADRYGLDTAMLSQAIVVTTLLSMCTLPLLAMLAG